MPNFIVPVVGNPNGGFQNGDQVTAENLNAHVVEAIPTGEFISGRDVSTTPNLTDYYLKVEADGSLKKIASSYIGANAENADHTTLKVQTITSRSGDGSATPYGSIALNNTGNLTFWLGAYNDPLNYNSGSFIVNASIQSFQYRAPIAGGNSNLFVIGDESKQSTFVCYAQTAYFRNTWPLDLSYNKKAVILPTGTTSERPVAGNGVGGVGSGMLRFNSEINDIEFYGTDGIWNGAKSQVLSIATKTGYTCVYGDGILYRSSQEWDIPADETWVVHFQAQWKSGYGGNTRPDYWYRMRAFATKATYVDVELKMWQRNYPVGSGDNDMDVILPLTRTSLASLSKKIEFRAYATNSDTVGGVLNPSVESNYNIIVYKYKTSVYNTINAIL